MSVTTDPVSAASRRPASLSFLKLAGPGLVVAATGIGSGDGKFNALALGIRHNF